MYYWRHPDKDYKSGLKRLENDATLFEMTLSAADAGEVDVYVRHLSEDELEDVLNKNQWSPVVIEEIINESEELPTDKTTNLREKAQIKAAISLVQQLVIVEAPTTEKALGDEDESVTQTRNENEAKTGH